ncbi:MAG: SH3 domain-containing protein [Alphaproteobacteria bacterium]
MRGETFALVLIAAAGAAAAQTSSPYFVSLRADKVYMREGPSKEHRIKWVYWRKGLPVEVVSSFDVWRRVRDMDGEMGWIHTSMLSNVRTVMVVGRGKAQMRSDAAADAPLVAEVQRGAVGRVWRCGDGACEVSFDGIEGWIDRARLWGVSAGAGD